MIDGGRPIALRLLSLISLHKSVDLDIFGTNMYRGISFRDAFDRVRDEYGKPIMFMSLEQTHSMLEQQRGSRISSVLHGGQLERNHANGNRHGECQ